MTQDHMTFEQRRHFTNTGVAHYISLMCLWDVSMEDRKDLLGMGDVYELNGLFANPKIHLEVVASEDALLRIGALVKLAEFLRHVLPVHKADDWVHCENPEKPFNGDTPLSYMITNGLAGVVTVTSMLASLAGERYPCE